RKRITLLTPPNASSLTKACLRFAHATSLAGVQLLRGIQRTLNAKRCRDDLMLITPGTKVNLKHYDPSDTGHYKSSDDPDDEIKSLLEELNKLQYLLYAQNKHALLVVLQGMDTSGKDGTIRKVMGGLSPLGVEVKAFKAP